MSARHVCARQDVAKMTLAALRSDATIGQKLTLAGPQAYTVSEVVALCERFANADADVTEVRSVLPPPKKVASGWCLLAHGTLLPCGDYIEFVSAQ